jgi:predicted RNase H-like HicB family nuclease
MVLEPGFRIEIDREIDGRWIADIPELPGAIVYGATLEEAVTKVEALGRRLCQLKANS